MIVVWGSSVINSVVSAGQFYCPGCRQARTYKLRQPREWATVFWIPIFRLKAYERYVACDACNATYGEHILRQDAATAQRELDAERERYVNLAGMICQLMTLMADERNAVSARLTDQIAGAVRHVLKLEMPPERPPGKIVGKGVDAVPELVRLLKEEAKVL